MDNLNVDWSSGWILCRFFGCEGKIHKPKPWINQACKEIHTATIGMKLTSVVCKLEIKINLSKSKVKLHPYSKSISTTKCVIFPLFKINIHHKMWNRSTTPNRYAPPPRTCTRGLQHVNWVCRPLYPKKQDKINVKLIHSFWVLRGFFIRENRKDLRIDWEKMYAIILKLESN